MIIKFFEINKINLNQAKLILIYGKNEGLKNQELEKLTKDNEKVFTYEEKEVLNNHDEFLELAKKFDLENSQALNEFMKLSESELLILKYFLKEKNISISQSNINIVIKKCNGDRENLINDLRKIENYCKNGKKINSEIISKLLSLYEDYSISELVDNCLAKNNNKTLYILNENNFSSDDCILITRTFLNKSKRILALSNNYRDNNNIDLTISSAKPPIFWKDKEIIKQQIFKWQPDNIRLLIYQINEIELLIKRGAINPINLITNFILEQSLVNASN